MRIFADADYPFLSWRHKAYLVSGLLLLAGVLAMVINAVALGSWLRYGVDFTGGTMIHVNFASAVQADEIRAVNPDWQITRFGEVDESEYLIRIPTFENSLGVDPVAEVSNGLTQAFGEDSFEVVRREAVSARVGGELQQRALLAILISLVGTLLYLAYRFEWRFGLAAVVGTLYNVLVTLGIVAMLRMEVSLTTVAAVLTIVGYSLNDTIVVFDRIRENLSKHRTVSFMETCDRAVNETLPRTVLTSGTTLATLLTLYLFGGAVIRDFALVLILGVAIATFATIFVATPALAEIEARWPRRKQRATPASGKSRRRTAEARV